MNNCQSPYDHVVTMANTSWRIMASAISEDDDPAVCLRDAALQREFEELAATLQQRPNADQLAAVVRDSARGVCGHFGRSYHEAVITLAQKILLLAESETCFARMLDQEAAWPAAAILEKVRREFPEFSPADLDRLRMELAIEQKKALASRVAGDDAPITPTARRKPGPKPSNRPAKIGAYVRRLRKKVPRPTPNEQIEAVRGKFKVQLARSTLDSYAKNY